MIHFLLFLSYHYAELVQLHVFQRSALHTPLVTIPSADFGSTGVLTDAGFDQAAQVGSYIRGYSEQLGHPLQYNGTKYTFYSTYLPRTKNTQYALATGLFPENGPKYQETTLFQDMQPIPIRSSNPENEYLLLAQMRCDDANRSISNIETSASLQSFVEQHKDMLQGIVQQTQCKNTPQGILHTIDALEYLSNNDLLPESLKTIPIADAVEFARKYRVLSYPVHDERYCNAALGLFLNQLASTTNGIASGNTATPQIFFYGAHRSTLVALFGCLTQANLSTVADPLPSPSALLVLEVHKDGDGTTDSAYTLKLSRAFNVSDAGDAELIPEKIANCGESCNYATFHKNYKHLLDIQDADWFTSYCGMHTSESLSRSPATGYIILLVFSVFTSVVGLILLIISTVCYLRK